MTTPKRRIVAALALTAVAAGAVYWFMQRPDPALHHPDHDAPADIATTDAAPREGTPESAPTSPRRPRHGGRSLRDAGVTPQALLGIAPLFDRLPEASVVIAPEQRRYQMVMHEIKPGWTITKEWEGYTLEANLAFSEVKEEEYLGIMFSGGRAPEYIRYDKDLVRMTKYFFAQNKPVEVWVVMPITFKLGK